ncbi:MAG TPA: DUF433 domain-containing protein [Ktedonobacterales bacterium]|jgi:uncharacterized protein (DUF433 family)
MSKPEIISDPQIMLGKPVIAGTRITVEFILEQLAAGETIEQIMDGYELTREQVQAALLFAAELARIDTFHPFEPTSV